MTTAALSPLRKQGDVSKDPTAPTTVLPRGSSAPPTATTSHEQGAKTSPTATTACTLGSSSSLLDTLAHCYTPHCTPGPSPYTYKRKVQGPRTKRLAAQENGLPDSLSLSLADDYNPLLQAHPTWAQDNTEAAGFPFLLFLPLRAPSRADPSGLGHAATIYSSVQGPPGVETPTVGAPGRGLLRVDEQPPDKLQMGSLQQPLQPGTMLRFGSLEFMSLDGSYDMILLPPPRDRDNGGRQPARSGIDDVFPTWRKSNIRVCPVTFPADGGGGGAGLAKQEVAPRRLSSESTAPAPQRWTRRALTSRLRRRRVSFPRNTPTPSRRTTLACSRRTCWALASYLRQRCSPSLTRLRHHPSIKRYRPFPVPCLLDSAATHQATSLRWTLS
jgi:hypothetical protein